MLSRLGDALAVLLPVHVVGIPWIRRSVPLALGVTLAVSGCGDSGPSKAEFIERADAICAAEAKRGEQLVFEQIPDPENPTARQVLFAVQAYSRIRRETAARVAALERPEDDDEEIQDWVDKTTAAVDRVETIPGAEEAIAALQASGTPADPFHEANQAAAEYGFDDCSV